MDQDPRRIGALSRALIESSKGSVSSVNPSADPVFAVERTKLMFGCYRKDDAADPETYSAAVASVLAEYTPDILQRVTDPRSGLPSRQNWLPTVKEVREACDELEQREKQAAERASREVAQLDERRRAHELAKQKPTLTELKEKHGDTWGLKVRDDLEAMQERRRQALENANRIMFERECEAAGMPKDSMISPELRSIIGGRGK